MMQRRQPSTVLQGTKRRIGKCEKWTMTTIRSLSNSTFLILKYKWRLLLIIGTVMIALPILMLKYSNNTILKFMITPRIYEFSSPANTKSKIYEVPSPANTKSISRIAREIAVNNSFVMVTLINEAYIPFTLSWLCNTKHLKIHHHVLFLTTDYRTDKLLHSHWPGVNSMILQGVDSKRNESYSQAGYVKLMVVRTETIMSILEENIAIFLFEVDCLWLKDPLDLLRVQNHVDIVATKVFNRESVIAGGFLYLFPTKATKILWKTLTKQMLSLSKKISALSSQTFISEGDNDQQYLSTLIRNKHGGVRVKMLNADEFPDGQWYTLSEKERMAMDPYIVNNNWMIGNDKKIERAKKWKHWFLKDDYTCDERNIALISKEVSKT